MNKYSTVTWSAAAILVASAISLTISNPAYATPQIASQTGKPCAQCHQKPDGGPELTAFGKAFQANGNKVPTKPAKLRRRFEKMVLRESTPGGVHV